MPNLTRHWYKDWHSLRVSQCLATVLPKPFSRHETPLNTRCYTNIFLFIILPTCMLFSTVHKLDFNNVQSFLKYTYLNDFSCSSNIFSLNSAQMDSPFRTIPHLSARIKSTGSTGQFINTIRLVQRVTATIDRIL